MEDFVDVIGYEGLYKINQLGEVFGVKNKKILKPKVSKDGYYVISLCKESKSKTFKLHRLICLHFLPNPLNLLQVDHIDRNKQNNSLENLRWVTCRDNNLNKDRKSSSGEQNIFIQKGRTDFKVRFWLDKKNYNKCFKTMEEAKVYRDAFKVEHNLIT